MGPGPGTCHPLRDPPKPSVPKPLPSRPCTTCRGLGEVPSCLPRGGVLPVAQMDRLLGVVLGARPPTAGALELGLGFRKSYCCGVYLRRLEIAKKNVGPNFLKNKIIKKKAAT